MVAVGVLAIYASGACPTIYAGDSGELVTAVHVLGIPHPTGYPLYVLLGKPWTLLFSAGSIAWRMSLFSALCAAASCGILYRLCRWLDLAPVSAAVAAFGLAFSPSFWGEANVQRVYALGALFIVLATAAALRWHRWRRPWDLALAFFLCGLGATNHMFMAIHALAIGGFVLALEPRTLLGVRALVRNAAAFSLGLLPYLYLPLRASANPPLNWGNPESLPAFLDVVLRRNFWARAWVEGPWDLVSVATDYVWSLGHELTWPGLALAIAGAVVAWQRRRLALLPLLVMAGNLAALASHGSRSDIFIWHRYYIPSYAMACLLAGLGCQALLARLPRRLRWLPLAIPAVLLATGWKQFDRSAYRIAEAYSSAVLASLPPGAHLVASDDNILFVLLYLRFVEHLRPDVDIIPQGVGAADLPPLRFDPETEPVFFTHHPNWNVRGLEILPVGLVFQACRAGRTPPQPVLPIESLPGEFDPGVPKDYLTQNLIGQFHYMLGFTFERRDWPRARRELEAAALAAPQNDVLFYNLGLLFQRNGLLDDALAALRRSQQINPRHLATQARPRASDRIAEVTAELQRLAVLEREISADLAPPVFEPGTVAYHLRLAERLGARGETTAARGHRMRALEVKAGAEPARHGGKTVAAPPFVSQ